MQDIHIPCQRKIKVKEKIIRGLTRVAHLSLKPLIEAWWTGRQQEQGEKASLKNLAPLKWEQVQTEKNSYFSCDFMKETQTF